MSLNFSFDGEGSSLRGAPRPSPEEPFRILVIGDFSGRASRGVIDPLQGRPEHRVTIDELEDLPKSLGVMIHAAGSDFDIMTTEDFHPTELFRRHAVFGALRDLRARLKNPSTFQAAAAEVMASFDARAAGDAPVAEHHAATEDDQPATDFEALLGGSTKSAPAKAAVDVDTLVRSIIAPFVIPAPDPKLDALITTVDQAIAGHMAAVLHDPAWQAVEACWRSLEMLIQRLELGEEMSLSLIDASRDELAQDLSLNENSGLAHAVVTKPTQTAGGSPFALIVWLNALGATEDDASLAAMLAGLGRAAGCPVAAGAHASLLGIASFTDASELVTATADFGGAASRAWADVVKSDAASALAILGPRTLMRLPYGPKTDPVEGFEFDEGPLSAASHDAYLWGPSSVLVAIALGQAFTEVGWRLASGGSAEIDDLPVHVLPDGEMKPCGEASISDRIADRMLSSRVCPVVSVQHRGAVRVPSIVSLAGGSLTARWA